MNIFINEPKLLNDLPLLGTFDLEFNLGLFIINNAKISLLNFASSALQPWVEIKPKFLASK